MRSGSPHHPIEVWGPRMHHLIATGFGTSSSKNIIVSLYIQVPHHHLIVYEVQVPHHPIVHEVQALYMHPIVYEVQIHHQVQVSQHLP